MQTKPAALAEVCKLYMALWFPLDLVALIICCVTPRCLIHGKCGERRSQNRLCFLLQSISEAFLVAVTVTVQCFDKNTKTKKKIDLCDIAIKCSQQWGNRGTFHHDENMLHANQAKSLTLSSFYVSISFFLASAWTICERHFL